MRLPAGTQECPQYRPDGHSSWQSPGKLFHQCWPLGSLQALHTHTKHLPHHAMQASLRYINPATTSLWPQTRAGFLCHSQSRTSPLPAPISRDNQLGNSRCSLRVQQSTVLPGPGGSHREGPRNKTHHVIPTLKGLQARDGPSSGSWGCNYGSNCWVRKALGATAALWLPRHGRDQHEQMPALHVCSSPAGPPPQRWG